MRDAQSKNVVLEQVPPLRKKRKYVSFAEEEDDEDDVNIDPNFTLLSDLLKAEQPAIA